MQLIMAHAHGTRHTGGIRARPPPLRDGDGGEDGGGDGADAG